MAANQWQGQYFDSKSGAVVSALAKLNADRRTYEAFQKSTACTNCPPGWYMRSLASAMSTVFSAVGSVWQVRNLLAIWQLIPVLRLLCEEYSLARVTLANFRTPAEDEVYIACLLRLGFITRLRSFYDFTYERIADEVGRFALEEVKKQEYATSTRLLLKARHSTNVLVRLPYRRALAKEVEVELSKLISQNLSKEEMEMHIGQGYKTICRLGRMTKRWYLCRVSLKHDRSKDLMLKTWMLPGYWLYQIRYSLGLAS